MPCTLICHNNHAGGSQTLYNYDIWFEPYINTILLESYIDCTLLMPKVNTDAQWCDVNEDTTPLKLHTILWYFWLGNICPPFIYPLHLPSVNDLLCVIHIYIHRLDQLDLTANDLCPWARLTGSVCQLIQARLIPTTMWSFHVRSKPIEILSQSYSFISWYTTLVAWLPSSQVCSNTWWIHIYFW